MQPELASGSPEVPNYPGYVFMLLIHPFIRHKIVRDGIVGNMQKTKKQNQTEKYQKPNKEKISPIILHNFVLFVNFYYMA